VNIATTLTQLALLACLCAMCGGLIAWAWLRMKSAPALPDEWTVSARSSLGVTERLLYQQLRRAFPQCSIMPKLGLVKFCQPDDPSKVGYWYRLLGSSQVTFAVCDADGWVLLAVDLEAERPRSRRSKQVKQSVLAACHIKHLIVTRGPLPALSELRALLPSGAPGSAQVATPPSQSLDAAWTTLANTVAARRAQRDSKWQESEVFQDSFFTHSGMVSAAEPVDSKDSASESAPDIDRQAAAPTDALTMGA
jgi:hypothetical protein